jgi:hypothetical protein
MGPYSLLSFFQLPLAVHHNREDRIGLSDEFSMNLAPSFRNYNEAEYPDGLFTETVTCVSSIGAFGPYTHSLG